MNKDRLDDAWWRLTYRHMPLIIGKHKVYVSPEAYATLSVRDELYWRDVVFADARLCRDEMRLETRCAL